MTEVDGHLPDRIGRYRVLDRLGSGGSGDVLLAEDERLHRRVAIKRLRGDFSETQRRRLEREAQVTAQLSHPAIVQLFEVLDTDDGQHLVLEWVEGETVAARLRRGPLPLNLAVNLGRQIAEALSEADLKGILHRDLKAENVILTPHGNAKVLDFGLAKAHQDPAPRSSTQDRPFTDSLTQEGMMVGTCRVMSPEQAVGGELGPRSDLFSLGVLLYEMLTGISPFQGAGPRETLTNLLTVHPRRLRELAPHVPPELDTLVADLLEKEPAQRPADAEKAARTLALIAARASAGSEEVKRAPEGPYSNLGDGFGDALTGYGSTEGISMAAGRGRASENIEGPASAMPKGRRWAWVLGVLAAVALLAVIWMSLLSAPSTIRRVAVLAPEIEGIDPSDNLALLATGILDTCLRTLVSFDDIRVLDPSQLRGIKGSPQAVAAAYAADNVLLIRILDAAGITQVDLRLMSVTDGTILWSRQVPVSPLPGDALQTADAVARLLREGFSSRPRTPIQPFDVRPEDYRAFLEVQFQTRHKNLPSEQALENLASIVENSPHLTSAHWMIASLAEELFSDTRRPVYLELARRHTREAHQLVPGDPRPRIHELRLALLAQELDQAAQVLEALDRIAPGEPETLYSHALLAKAQGKSKVAIEILGRLVERRPSWRYLHQLATLEYRAGDVAAARLHLNQILDRDSRNTWALNALVQLELLNGDLVRAEELAQELVGMKPHRSYWTNLGIARFLLGRYEEAHQAYAQALELDPEHPTTLLNLGDTLQSLELHQEAQEVYRKVLDILDNRSNQRDLSPSEQINRAQCLAHLGEFQQAVESTLAVLEHADDDAELAYQAALVFILAGDQTSALIKARHALKSGMDLRWFRIPPFRDLLDQLLATNS